MDCISRYDSPLGRMLMTSDGEALTGLRFSDEAHVAAALSADAVERDLPVFRETAAWLDRYFNGGRPDGLPRLRLIGTPFRLRVWQAVQKIPYGQTVSYAALAKRLDASPRAVGNAAAHNPVLLIVPCHRVIGTDGRLTGYAGGLERKRKLIELEQK